MRMCAASFGMMHAKRFLLEVQKVQAALGGQERPPTIRDALSGAIIRA